MFEGGISNRDRCSNRGSLASFPVFFLLGAQGQEVIQDLCWCEVADEPVVVMKFRPLKASNGVEGKTGMIISIKSDEIVMSQKP